MARLSEEKIKQIQALYQEIGIYSEVARQVGCSPATVKKYASITQPTITEVIHRPATKAPEPFQTFLGYYLVRCQLTETEIRALKEMEDEIDVL